jgi:steroid delta-isomerase-like uncharacterized protein
MPMTRDEIDRFFARRAVALRDRDLDVLTADHAEGSVVESPTHGKLTTREAIRRVYATWFEAFPDLVFEQEDLLVEGDRVALFFTATGTHRKSFGNVPASNRQVSIRGAFLFTLRDGHIVHEKRYYDSTSLLVQIGVLKAKPV